METSFSHYRILERLGSGGMSEVYRALDLSLNRIVAIKLIPPELLDDDSISGKLINEARVAASITHPNIATIYEIGLSEKRPFIALEYIEGPTLSAMIAHGPMAAAKALDVAIQISDALEAAHRRGLIHCDIKSANIVLTGHGAKLLDFGIARLASANPASATRGKAPIEREASKPQIARSAVGAGSVCYMSPEQAADEVLDQRTDLFSLGIVLYEMLSGRRPFDGESTVAVLRAVCHSEPPVLRQFQIDVPLELERIVRKALEKHRGDRYQNAREMKEDLSRLRSEFETGQPAATARQPGSQVAPARYTGDGFYPARFVRAHSRKRSLLFALSIGALMLALLDVWLLRPSGLERVRAAVLLSVWAGSLAGYVRLRGRTAFVLPPSLAAGSAFRGLLPFQEADRNRFCGREVETSGLTEMIVHPDYRFGVIYGESGSGKTSLLRAALIPGLWEMGWLPIYCRSYKNPQAAVFEECATRSRLRRDETESAPDYLRRVVEELNTTVVIVCDQFEEFFVSFKSKDEREPFTTFVADCWASGVRVRFLFSLRSDFLHLIGSEFDGCIEEPLAVSKRFHLHNFTRAQAEEIIERSVRVAGMSFQAGFSRYLARDLASGDTVLPSELQIVGEQLQTRRIFSLEAYRRTGGKEQLVYSHLEDAINACPDRDAAKLLLRSLISDENTRLTLSVDEIARRIQRGHGAVESMLQGFVGSRLIREIQDEAPWRYELIHEYLIARIESITGGVMDATQRANRRFREALSQYALDKRTRIPLNKLWSIKRYSDIAHGERERELLSKSLSRGLVRWSAALMVGLASVATLVIAIAAWVSQTEVWESVPLSDGHTAGVERVVFSPDGRRVVSAGEDGKVIVWDFERRQRIATLTDHVAWVRGLAYSSDGKWLATGADDHTVIIWDAARLEKLSVLKEHRTGIGALDFSPDGRFLASSSGAPDQRTIIWRTGVWTRVSELPQGTSEHSNLQFFKDGHRVLSGRSIFDTATGTQVSDLGETWSAGWQSFSPDSKRLVAIDAAGLVSFLDMPEKNAPSPERAHHDNGRAVAFSPDGRIVATAAENIILWDAATRKKLVTLEYEAMVWSVAFSPDGRWLVSSHGDGAILVWDVGARERIANLNEHSAPVRVVAYSRDGRLIASAGDDHSIIVWDAAEGRKEAVLVGHRTRVTGLAFGPDGTWLASCDLDSNVTIWDIAQRKPRAVFEREPPSRQSFNLVVSPDGKLISDDQGVYDSSDGHEVVDFRARFAALGFPPVVSTAHGFGFSRDGSRLICSLSTGEIGVWDTRSWEITVTTRTVETADAGALSPDGKQLVTGHVDGALRLWDISTWREVSVLGRHASRVKSVAFSPDGRQVASAGDDKTIALWDVRSLKLAAHIGTHAAPVLSIAFSPNGKHLVVGGHDRSVRVYTRHGMRWGRRLD